MLSLSVPISMLLPSMVIMLILLGWQSGCHGHGLCPTINHAPIVCFRKQCKKWFVTRSSPSKHTFSAVAVPPNQPAVVCGLYIFSGAALCCWSNSGREREREGGRVDGLDVQLPLSEQWQRLPWRSCEPRESVGFKGDSTAGKMFAAASDADTTAHTKILTTASATHVDPLRRHKSAFGFP